MFISFHSDGFLFVSGYEWIGWRNDTPGLLGKPVEIVFEFDTVRNFSAIVLHTNNMFTKDVQVSANPYRLQRVIVAKKGWNKTNTINICTGDL